MNREEFLLRIFCLIDDEIKALGLDRVRQRGFEPTLRDSEVITIEIAGEFWGMDQDTEIFQFFRHYHLGEFPALARVHRTTFVRQAANLWQLKERLRRHLAGQLTEGDWLWLLDSLPLPVCQFARAPSCRRFRGLAAYGRDELIRQTFYGFRLHLRANPVGVVGQMELTPANVSDLAAVHSLLPSGVGLGDRNYWSPKVMQELAQEGLKLLAPFKSAKHDPDPQRSFRLSRIRRIIETSLGELVERFHIKRSWARDLWHLTHRLVRKVLSYTVGVWLNAQLGRPLLQLAGLVVD